MKDEIILKLIKSTVREDVILGMNFLSQKSYRDIDLFFDKYSHFYDKSTRTISGNYTQTFTENCIMIIHIIHNIYLVFSKGLWLSEYYTGFSKNLPYGYVNVKI